MNRSPNYRRIAFLTMKLVEEADCDDCKFYQNCDFTEMSCWYHHEKFVMSGGDIMNGYEVIRELNKIKPYTGNVSDIYKRDKAIEAAKDAVKKQIPQDVVYSDEVTMFSKSEGRCPECGSEMMRDRLVMEKRSISYCCMCGQALDWGEL